MNDKKPWSDEPTPLTDGERVVGMENGIDYVDAATVADLERRLRHAERKLAELGIPLDLGPGLE